MFIFFFFDNFSGERSRSLQMYMEGLSRNQGYSTSHRGTRAPDSSRVSLIYPRTRFINFSGGFTSFQYEFVSIAENGVVGAGLPNRK